MPFNSFPFAIFLLIVFIAYWFVFTENVLAKNVCIFISSYVFYAWWDWRFLFLIAFSSLIGFFFGWWIDSYTDSKKRKWFLILTLTINLLFLGVFKYFNFFSSSFEYLLHSIGFNADLITLKWILPIGISFYTFHNISYIIDVYRRDIPATKDIFIYLSFMSYFPQLVAGPIQRAKDLIPQFEKERIFNTTQAIAGLQQILWGLFKKVVIADTCAVQVNSIFNQYTELSGLQLILGTMFFAFQIYGDFSGYTDMALGISKLFGIELTPNFKTPYFAKSIPDFWRRWHISLTTWFKDYLYIPLGGSKNGLSITVRNTLIVFLISGFWHGANWTFIVWGLLNALYFLPYLFFQLENKTVEYTYRDIAHMLLVFCLICFSWIFFRAASLTEAIDYINHIPMNTFLPPALLPIFPASLMMYLLFFFCVEWLFFKSNGFEPIAFNSRCVSWTLYACILLLVLMNMSFHTNSEFIYFQF